MCVCPRSPTQQAPELYVQLQRSKQNLPALPYDGLKVDVWAIGICLLVLCKGNYPYPAAKGQDAAEGARLVADGQLVTHVHEEVAHLLQHGIITPECQRVMLRCLQEQPAQRPSAAELAADPWFTQHGPYPQAVRGSARADGQRACTDARGAHPWCGRWALGRRSRVKRICSQS